MKAEWRLFAGAGAFFTVTGTAYWFASYEDAGTTMLALAVVSVLMVAGWLLFQSRRLPGPRPSDRVDAVPADGAGALGSFPARSIWPFVIAWGAVVLANALVFGVFLGVVGGLIVLVGVVGYVAEAGRRAK